jgi:hypothetical protein
MHCFCIDLDGDVAGHEQASAVILELVEKTEVASADRGGGVEAQPEVAEGVGNRPTELDD